LTLFAGGRSFIVPEVGVDWNEKCPDADVPLTLFLHLSPALWINEKAEAVSSSAASFEVPLIKRCRTERLLVLAEEESKGVWSGDKDV